MDKCKKCKKEIIWMAHNQTKQVNPIESEANEKGNLVINREKEIYRFATKEEIQLAKETGKKLYISHFATCKFAEMYRSKKKK